MPFLWHDAMDESYRQPKVMKRGPNRGYRGGECRRDYHRPWLQESRVAERGR